MKTNFLCRNALPRGSCVFLRLGLILIALLSLNLIGYGQVSLEDNIETCFTGKHLKRTSPNLLDDMNSKFPDPDVPNSTHRWLHIKEGCSGVDNDNISAYQLWTDDDGYDDLGCIKLLGSETPGNIYIDSRTCMEITPEHGYDSNGNPVWGKYQGNATNATNDRIILQNVEINGDKTYTISVRCKTMNSCHSPVMIIFLTGNHPTAGQRAFTFSTAKADVWEEFSFTFKMPPGVTKMNVEIANYRQETDDDENMVAYIDNLYIGEGVSFEDPPSCKRSFNGEGVKVDELGNFHVKNADGDWEWFFPFIMHGDIRRAGGSDLMGWETYATQGFNTIITTNQDSHIDAALNAGLRVIPHLGFYYAGGDNNAPLTELEDRLNRIKKPDNTQNPMSNLLAYYIDNEVHEVWELLKDATDKVMEWEAANVTDNNNNRIAPIYINNGHPGLAPKYLSYDENEEICHVGDITGSYIQFSDEANQIATNWRMQAMDHSSNQSMPSNIAQINGDRLFRARIYGSIAAGARGMGYFRDYAPKHPEYIPNCYDDAGEPIEGCPDSTNENYKHLFDHLNDGPSADGIILDIVYNTNNDNDTNSDNDTYPDGGNGIIDIAETYFNSDGDEFPDILDADANGDGDIDTGKKDADNDQIIDDADVDFNSIDQDGNGVPDNLVHDYNGDCEITTEDIEDIDGDGILDHYISSFDKNNNDILDKYEIDDDDGDGLIVNDFLNQYYVDGTLTCDTEIGENWCDNPCLTPDYIFDHLDGSPNTDSDGDGNIVGDILNSYIVDDRLKPSNDITQVPWWEDFPCLVREIYDLQGLIRQPHWTNTWGVSSCVSSGQTCEDANFIIGTREWDNKGHLIIANYGIDAVTATVTFSGLPFSDATLRPLTPLTFSTSVMDTPSFEITNSQAEITLPEGGAGVYIIETDIPTVSPTSCLDDIFVSGNLSRLYEAAQTVTTNGSTDILPDVNAELKGGEVVTLKSGFKATRGSAFKARIAPCDGCETETCTTLPTDFSKDGDVDLCKRDATKSEKDESDLQVAHYPNPFRDEVIFEFQLDADADVEITISDVNGRGIDQIEIDGLYRGIKTHNLSTKNWIPGVYFYQVQIKEQNTGILKHANGTLVKM